MQVQETIKVKKSQDVATSWWPWHWNQDSKQMQHFVNILIYLRLWHTQQIMFHCGEEYNTVNSCDNWWKYVIQNIKYVK